MGSGWKGGLGGGGRVVLFPKSLLKFTQIPWEDIIWVSNLGCF